MISVHRWICITLALTLHAATANATHMGWQGMRVIFQEGRPHVMRAGDVDGDGTDELIVVNTVHSRIDLYRWLPAGQRGESRPTIVHSNDVPMPPDFRREEIALEHLPRGAELLDLDHDGKLELVVLVSPPNKLLVYKQTNQRGWNRIESFDLLSGEIAPRGQPLLIRPDRDGDPEVLIGLSNGIQQLTLSSGARPKWLTPREKRTREAWWLADLDGDGDHDLVEQSRESDKSLRWFPRASSGHFMPAQILFDRGINGANVLRAGKGPDDVLLLDGATQGLLRRFRLVRGKFHELGQQKSLAIQGGLKALWCGLKVDGQPTLVAADRDRPRLLMYPLAADGWGSQQSFPVIDDLRALAAPVAQPGTLLLWAEGAADLYISRWQGGRISFPELWQQTEEPSRKIIALASVGSTTWWLQQVGKDCDLYVWPADETAPSRTRYEKIGFVKGGLVQWLGADRLLVRRSYRDSPTLVSKQGETTVISTPAHLKQFDVDEVELIAVNESIRVARRANGVLQWLGDELQPIDQVMLPQERELAAYAAIDESTGWALEGGGRFIHRLETDAAGIAQVQETIRISGGVSLVRDAVLGLILVDHDRVVALTAGEPYELRMIETIDGRMDRRSGVRQATIHRISCVDLDGDKADEVVLMDDRRHQLSVLDGRDGKLQQQISWPVFEDKKYPYSDDPNAPTVTEPRVLVPLDVDGDGCRDLAMACHDRLIFYLGRDNP